MYTELSSAEGKRHGDPLVGPFFVVAHFRAQVAKAIAHPSCVFPSLTDNTHIVGPPDQVVAALTTLTSQLISASLRVQPRKSITWSPTGLPREFALPPGFLCPASGIRVLGSPIGSSAYCLDFAADSLGSALASSPLLPKLGDT
jgi:hypothetical protein